MTQSNILLESGTNELEIIVFEAAGALYGINVMKVREILQPEQVTPLPHSHPDCEGIADIRGEIVPVINLEQVLGNHGHDAKESKFIIAELNSRKAAFRVTTVTRIHRVSWEQIESPDKLESGDRQMTAGIIQLHEKLILLLDYERIVHDILPSTGFMEAPENHAADTSADASILIAEDSPMLQRLLKDTLTGAGFSKLTIAASGKKAWELLEEDSSRFQLLITDIEMPEMDGHHLTKKVKQHIDLPVVIFSSLITTDLFHKGEAVGADAQISKPEINQLIGSVNDLLSSAHVSSSPAN
ncbi:chemotaxis protein CheV [Alkalicoccus luteus]|uniref:Chemotaxis protein CheV n=1 Tax=Alkalicoccus luteus TaxID=1237094 RepID=A0A969PSP9_9BACI|nr:chemotaxis protein [Alkalicoccus luteus]NJP37233.1 chemotaxis protein CheV [Alkalicoccus luteus]